MYCGNCGNQIKEDAQFCGNCGAEVPKNDGGNKAENSQNEYRNLQNDRIGGAEKRRPSTAPIVIIAVICALIVAAAVIILLGSGSDKNGGYGAGGNDGLTSVIKNGGEYVTLTIDDYPEEIDTDVVELSGTIVTEQYAAKLTIDGSEVKSIDKLDGVTVWSIELSLAGGENVFDVELTDSAGNRDSGEVKILCLAAWPFPYGTKLVRTDQHPNYKIYVRPGPSIESGNPILEIMPDDFSTTLTYLGEYQEDNDSENGLHYWYKVSLPDGREGWIRDDLAMEK